MDRPIPQFALRPLELKQFFDFAIRLYRSNFAPMFLSMAMVQLPLSLISVPFIMRITQMQEQMNAATMTGEDPFSSLYEFADLAVWMIVMTFGGLAYQLLVMPLGNITCAKLATEALFGRRLSFSQAFTYCLKRYWPTQVALATFMLPLLILSVVLLAIVLLTVWTGNDTSVLISSTISIFLIATGMNATLLLWFRFFPALSGVTQAAEQPEGVGIFAQGLWYLRRSYGLTSGNYFRLFGLLALMSIAVGAITNGINQSTNFIMVIVQALLAGEGAGEVVTSLMFDQPDPPVVGMLIVISSLFALLFPPIWQCYKVLLYFDLRCRKEAFDLKHLLGRAVIAQ
ncbi:hypothetical protein IIA79_04925 [bacterium]|nr:hypothetical protein [bacterium]